jgi:hypothetical protein
LHETNTLFCRFIELLFLPSPIQPPVWPPWHLVGVLCTVAVMYAREVQCRGRPGLWEWVNQSQRPMYPNCYPLLYPTLLGTRYPLYIKN